MVYLLIYLQGDLLVCAVIGRYVFFCVVLLADACLASVHDAIRRAMRTSNITMRPTKNTKITQ